MPVNRVLAGIAVADVEAALPWYELLFGRPADELSMAGLAEWHVSSGGVVQLVASVERAGRSLLTLDFARAEREAAGGQAPNADRGLVDSHTSVIELGQVSVVGPVSISDVRPWS